jgi:hypothetical protein
MGKAGGTHRREQKRLQVSGGKACGKLALVWLKGILDGNNN